MRLLHTSDWHLGRMLHGELRHEEHERFLAWLIETIQEQAIDVLLVAGDVFDITTPPHRAQQLYYRFLHQLSYSACRHVVITAGNHDSPSFLEAPKDLLRAMNVHVVGLGRDPAEEVLVLRDAQDRPELVVCAVPYLRDGDIRTVEAAESIVEKEYKRAAGIRAHYQAAAALAQDMCRELGVSVPMVAMGHLFTAGGHTIEGDGVRELYVGALGHVPAAIFDACFDYVALGHLHVPQQVGNSCTMRYSGSPLPMGFGEAGQQKSVCLVTFHSVRPTVAALPIPMFRRLERIKGSWPVIAQRLEVLRASDEPAWLEVIYDGDEVIADLAERLEPLCTADLQILSRVDLRKRRAILGQLPEIEALEELDEQEVFERCLEAREVPHLQREALREAHAEILRAMRERDVSEPAGP